MSSIQDPKRQVICPESAVLQAVDFTIANMRRVPKMQSQWSGSKNNGCVSLSFPADEEIHAAAIVLVILKAASVSDVTCRRR
jgi:hypothetical protein